MHKLQAASNIVIEVAALSASFLGYNTLPDDPYKPLAVEPDSVLPAPEVRPPVLRKGVGPAIAILWNLQPVLIAYLNMIGIIDDQGLNILIGCIAGTIPVGVLATAYVRPLQGLLFVSEVGISGLRSRVWGVTILWAILSAVWIVFSIMDVIPGFGFAR